MVERLMRSRPEPQSEPPSRRPSLEKGIAGALVEGDTIEEKLANLKEFYIERQGQYPLLAEALEGKATFTGRLDELFAEMDSKSGVFSKKSEVLAEFRDYATTLSQLDWWTSGRLISGESYADDARKMMGAQGAQLATGAGILLWYGGLVLFFIPPFSIIEPFVWATGEIITGTFRDSARRGRHVRDSKESVFAPLYSAAAGIDHAIGRCFLYEHFEQNRERFALAYRGMSADERQGVEEELYHCLEAGALDMGEAELDSYLDGLRQQEAGHEGTILRRDMRYHDVHGLCAVEFDMTPEEFQEEKDAHAKAKGLRGRAPSEYMSIELENLLCGFPDRLRIVKVFGRGKEAEEQGEAYIEEMREWHRNRDDEYLRELADILW